MRIFPMDFDDIFKKVQQTLLFATRKAKTFNEIQAIALVNYSATTTGNFELIGLWIGDFYLVSLLQRTHLLPSKYQILIFCQEKSDLGKQRLLFKGVNLI